MPKSRLSVVVTRRLPERGRNPFVGIVRSAPERNGYADGPRRADCGDPGLRCSGANPDRQYRHGFAGSGRRTPEADRQLRRGGRPYRRGDRAAARNSGVEHARCGDRGHRRHDHGPYAGGDAQHPRRFWRRCRRATGQAGRPWPILARESAASGWAFWVWAGSVRRWHAGRRPLVCRSIITTVAACARMWKARWRPLGGESLDQMVARMDIISVNLSHTPATFHLLNGAASEIAETIGHRHSILSRGEVIDEKRADPRLAGRRDCRGRTGRARTQAQQMNSGCGSPMSFLLPHRGRPTAKAGEIGEKVIHQHKGHFAQMATPARYGSAIHCLRELKPSAPCRPTHCPMAWQTDASRGQLLPRCRSISDMPFSNRSRVVIGYSCKALLTPVQSFALS